MCLYFDSCVVQIFDIIFLEWHHFDTIHNFFMSGKSEIDIRHVTFLFLAVNPPLCLLCTSTNQIRLMCTIIRAWFCLCLLTVRRHTSSVIMTLSEIVISESDVKDEDFFPPCFQVTVNLLRKTKPIWACLVLVVNTVC